MTAPGQPTCIACRHHGRYGVGTASERLICTRAPHQPSCPFERDSIPEPQRPSGDKCGPEGRHWRPVA